jgi:hypothetical protein
VKEEDDWMDDDEDENERIPQSGKKINAKRVKQPSPGPRDGQKRKKTK